MQHEHTLSREAHPQCQTAVPPACGQTPSCTSPDSTLPPTQVSPLATAVLPPQSPPLAPVQAPPPAKKPQTRAPSCPSASSGFPSPHPLRTAGTHPPTADPLPGTATPLPPPATAYVDAGTPRGQTH